MSDILARAADFIWRNARLLDRQRFAFHFENGSRQDVVHGLLAYQNGDGGFGAALEPDLRDPSSQPVPAQHALEVLDEVGFDETIALAVCDWLERITTDQGGVPFVLPSARHYPHAPWWEPAEAPEASLNPTAAIVGLLVKNGIQHHWVERASAYCWQAIEHVQADDMHALGCVLTFLQYTPDQERANRIFDDLGRTMLANGVIAPADAEGYVRKASEWAPQPDHPLRRIIPPEMIAADLARLQRDQAGDGGWPIAWQPPSQAAGWEWRGWVTVNALRTLRDNGLLEHTGA